MCETPPQYMKTQRTVDTMKGEDPPEDHLLHIIEFGCTTVQSAAEGVKNLQLIIQGLKFDLACALESEDDHGADDLRAQLSEAKLRLADYQAQVSLGMN